MKASDFTCKDCRFAIDIHSDKDNVIYCERLDSNQYKDDWCEEMKAEVLISELQQQILQSGSLIKNLESKVAKLDQQNTFMLGLLKRLEWDKPVAREKRIRIKDNNEYQELQKWFIDRGEPLRTEHCSDGSFYIDLVPDSVCYFCHGYKSEGHKDNCEFTKIQFDSDVSNTVDN